ncbi:MAG: hypothetical protein HY205_07165 [Nitrospirae bacterium]|nr:hypothetical protein [Nitrospirota bacterium]
MPGRFFCAFLVWVFVLGSQGGCATAVPADQPALASEGSVVFGRLVTVLMAPSSRTHEPKVRFFELMNRGTQERTRVTLDSNDAFFVVKLPAGDYELARAQIHEGPFMAMADVSLAFQVGNEPLSYVGTWRIGVDVPGNNRQMLVSAVHDRADQEAAEAYLRTHYPALAGQPIAALLSEPASLQTPLYEVMPYPRVTPYYRRHW